MYARTAPTPAVGQKGRKAGRREGRQITGGRGHGGSEVGNGREGRQKASAEGKR